MADELRTTALHSVHEALDARLIDFAGWAMPVWYGSATDEHIVVRTSAGLFDLGHMGELMVTGPQAAAALDHAVILHASAMPIGRARYTMILNDEGGIIDDLITYRLAEDRFMVVANASNAGVVFDELVDRSADFDATVTDETESWALIAIQGPVAAGVLQQLVSEDLDEIRYYRIDEMQVLGVDAMVARTGYTGEDGFEVFVPQASAAELWNQLIAVGDGTVHPTGLAARDTLRLEAGMPLYGNELSLDTTPFDVGAGRLIKADNPDHVGSAALAAIADGSHRHLAGLVVDGRRPARSGYDVVVDDTVIGTLTSGAPSPTLDQNIAIALVDRELAIGDVVTVDVRGTATPATVVALPFYKRP